METGINQRIAKLEKLFTATQDILFDLSYAHELAKFCLEDSANFLTLKWLLGKTKQDLDKYFADYDQDFDEAICEIKKLAANLSS